MKTWLRPCFIALAFAHPAVGQSVSDPARIEVHVTPYYNSDGPIIEVGPFSKGLAAKTEPEFVETILKMKQSWSELRFPEMYVAAIRLYDLGFRNESTYWFYSAQYRGRLFASLVDQEKMGVWVRPRLSSCKWRMLFNSWPGHTLMDMRLEISIGSSKASSESRRKTKRFPRSGNFTPA
jgi:hypothetical protein